MLSSAPGLATTSAMYADAEATARATNSAVTKRAGFIIVSDLTFVVCQETKVSGVPTERKSVKSRTEIDGNS